MKKIKLILSIAFAVLFLDHLTKFLAIRNIGLNESLPIIEGFFHLTFITNTGTAFGLFKGVNFVFVAFSIAVVAAILYNIKNIKENEKSVQAAVGLLLGGALGNLLDRIVHGFVVDFLDFRIWPVFNIADSAITVSVIMLIFLLWKK